MSSKEKQKAKDKKANKSTTVMGSTFVVRTGVPICDLQAAAKREIQATLKQARGSARQAVKLGFRRLYAENLLSDRELKDVEKIYDLVDTAGRGRCDATKTFLDISNRYQDMLINGSCDLALTLADSARAIFEPLPPTKDSPPGVAYSVRSTWKTMRENIMVGVAVGAAIGGGSAGGVIGGVIGAIVGTIEVCTE